MYSIYKPFRSVELEALLTALINIEILTSKFCSFISVMLLKLMLL